MSQHHDPVHPDSDHLTAETLADLGLGLLDETSAAHAEHHLAHCADCRALRDQFPALADALADLPDEPMPEPVWQRLSAALADEPVTTPEGSATVVPIEAARQRRWRRPGIGLVAGAAGVALLGAIVVPSIMNASDDSAGVTAASDSSRDDQGTNKVPMAAYAATQSGTKYQEAALDSQVTQLVAARTSVTGDTELVTGSTPSSSPSPTASATSKPTSESPSPSANRSVAAMATDPAAAQACLVGYLDAPDVQPLAIDIGTWRGEPAAIIVLPNDDPALADVFVIDPDCAGPGDPLFYFATVSR